MTNPDGMDSKATRTVLLIDDEPQMLFLVSMCLEELDARVVRATDLSEARTAARTVAPDMVLLDLALEGEDGMALLPCLRSEPVFASVPVVVFSVHESRRREALECGANDFVAKPFRPDRLRAVVQRHLEAP